MTYTKVACGLLRDGLNLLRIKESAILGQIRYLQSKCKHPKTKTTYSSFCGQVIEWNTCEDCGYETHKDVPEKEDSWDSDET